jgi:hypothetical protein
MTYVNLLVDISVIVALAFLFKLLRGTCAVRCPSCGHIYQAKAAFWFPQWAHVQWLENRVDTELRQAIEERDAIATERLREHGLIPHDAGASVPSPSLPYRNSGTSVASRFPNVRAMMRVIGKNLPRTK